MNVTTEDSVSLLARVFEEARHAKPYLPEYLHILVSAIFPIVIAAHASLRRPSSAASNKRKKSRKRRGEDDGTDVLVEAMTLSDVILFPLMAGSILTTLYMLLKWLEDPSTLNRLLGWYFSWAGLFFSSALFKDCLSLIRSLCLPKQYSSQGRLWRASPSTRQYVAETQSGGREVRSSPLPGPLGALSLPHFLSTFLWHARHVVYAETVAEISIYKLLQGDFPVEVLDLVSVTLSAVTALAHSVFERPWYLTNVLGFSFSYGSLQFLSPGTSGTGTLLLSALLIYDIYMVFYTPMMLTVATKLDIPIKLVFPASGGCVLPSGSADDSPEMRAYLQCMKQKKDYSMLGLGDIVIPGVMIAYAMRFDLYKFYLKLQRSGKATGQATTTAIARKATYVPVRGGWGERLWTNRHQLSQRLKAKSFPKPYFYATLTGYIVGLIVTLVVLQVFKRGQPALFYLVPGVLLALWGTAAIKGDVGLLWNYSELPEDEEGHVDKTTSAEDKKESKSDESKAADTSSQSEGHDAKTRGHNLNAGKDEDKARDSSTVKLFSLSITMVSNSDDEEEEEEVKEEEDADDEGTPDEKDTAAVASTKTVLSAS